MKIPEKRAVVLSTPQARHLLDLLEERKARNLNNFRIRKSFGHGQYKKGDQQLFQFADGQAVLELPQIEEIARYSNDGGKIVALHTGAPDCEVGMSHLREILGILRDPYNMDKQISPTNGEIEVFFSYVPYSKADLGFSIGGNVKAKWLFKELIETYAVSRFHGIDIHFYKEKIPWIHEFPINALSVEEVMLQSVLDATRKTIDDYMVIDSAPSNLEVPSGPITI